MVAILVTSTPPFPPLVNKNETEQSYHISLHLRHLYLATYHAASLQGRRGGVL